MPTSPPPQLVERLPFVEWSNLHAHLTWIYDGAVEPRFRQGSIEAPHLTAWLVRRGSVNITVRNVKLQAHAGEWMFPPSGTVAREFSPDAKILSVRFRASWPTGEELFDDGLGLVFPAAKHPELERAAGPLARFTARTFPDGYRFLMEQPATLAEHLRLQVLFARWLEAVVRALTAEGVTPSRMGRIDPRLLHAIRVVERRAIGAPFAERTLAREVGLSLSQLERLFKRQFGISPRGFCERRRHEYALAALQSSPQTVKEIAFQLGFSSLPHFSGWFRRREGMSPREFRRARPRG